jgi:uncharacterized protein (TIGR01777 family)
MRVIITGATGFIGKALCKEMQKDYEIIALSRDMNKATELLAGLAEPIQWDGQTAENWADYADGASAIINLAGDNIASGRWRKAKKERILGSRLAASQAVLSAIKEAKKKPEVFVQASAVGYYGARGDEVLDEVSAGGEGFLAQVSRRSEGLAKEVQDMGVRCVIIRTGIVLGAGGGVLQKLMGPFRFYLGGCYGDPKVWLSWISLKDEISAIKFLLENSETSGVFNLTSPEPELLGRFHDTLGRVMSRPAWLKPPGFLLKLAMGEMAQELLLSGQRVMPKRLLDAGFEFGYEDLTKALVDILSERKNDGLR